MRVATCIGAAARWIVSAGFAMPVAMWAIAMAAIFRTPAAIAATGRGVVARNHRARKRLITKVHCGNGCDGTGNLAINDMWPEPHAR